jgi:biotin carboxylase
MLKGDIVIYRGVAHVIEVATRLSGGYLCTLEIPLASGVDFVGAVMAWALGEPVDPQRLVPKRKQYVCQRYAFLPPGRVTAVSGLETARALPGVAEIVLYVEPGDIIRTPTDTTARAAMVVVTGETRRIAHERAQAALAALKIETAPDTNREEPKALRA